MNGWETRELRTDILIIGGGAAGCAAAVAAKDINPEVDVTIIEKAQIERSGCLAAGINAINAYLNPGETPESFTTYVRRDTAGLIRSDLVYTIAQGVNQAAHQLEQWGLPFLKDEQGQYRPRGPRSVAINGERIKPVMAGAVWAAGVRVLNRINATNYILVNGRVSGVYAVGIREPVFYIIRAGAVICATGGASGLYSPNNGGQARHKMWYPPFNTGAGYAMGIRAGAEMTSLEMRFIALRVKDVLAPTGTVAQGVKAPQINRAGVRYLTRYPDANTADRLWATLVENQEGRGPCALDTRHLDDVQAENLRRAYLNMCPGIVLWWADRDLRPQDQPLEICGSEPYLVGGHAQAGYWVDTRRRTTLPGLYAAGDVAGGAPKKYVTGSMVEGEIAVQTALGELQIPDRLPTELLQLEMNRVVAPMKQNSGVNPQELEAQLQQTLDEYAGGIAKNYEVNETGLLGARRLLNDLRQTGARLKAGNLHELVLCHEVIDRIDVARVMVEHLLHRQETRWPCYQSRIDYPQRDDTHWLKFVNTVYLAGVDRIEIKERPCTEAVEAYEHCG